MDHRADPTSPPRSRAERRPCSSTATTSAPGCSPTGPRWRTHLPTGSWQLTIWVRSAANPTSGTAIDVGCGTGRALAALRELARITRPGGRLVLFHPSGRAALAARHGRTLRPDEPLAEPPLRGAAQRTGWHLTGYDDPPHRFLAVATRR